MKDAKEFSAVKNSIQTRLSGVMLLVLVFALGINVFIFAQIRTAVGRIDAVFSSNTAINELSDSIEQVESTVYEYLNTNSSQALENYYRDTLIERKIIRKNGNYEKIYTDNLLHIGWVYLCSLGDLDLFSEKSGPGRTGRRRARYSLSAALSDDRQR